MIWFRWGCIMMFAAIALGAFGTHGLKDHLTPESLHVYNTAVLYHLVHGLALLGVGWLSTLSSHPRLVRVAGWAFLLGILLFSGSLYGFAITGEKWFAQITPLGGLSFLSGWILLAIAAQQKKR